MKILRVGGAVLAVTAGLLFGSRAVPVVRRGSWLIYGRDLANSRANTSSGGLPARAVPSIVRSWSKDGIVGVVGTPTVSGGVAYFADLTGTVWAVDASSGRLRWQSRVAPGVVGASAVSGGFVYVASGNTLYGLDRSSGTIRWKVVTNANSFAQISASPVVFGGRVIIGTASFEVMVRSSQYTFQGSVGAFDAQTGRALWNFVTTPNDESSGAGEGIWSTPAIAPKLGLLFVGTGQNLSPPPGPLEDSILAIDVRTGQLRWSRQFFTNDVFSAGHPGGYDYDFGASPNLWSAHGRTLVGDGEKSGTFVALDAATGRVVWQRALTPGGPFGGVLGSGAYVDGRLVVSANIGKANPKASKVLALNPATGAVEWTQQLAGNVYGPVSAVPGVAFVGTDQRQMVALQTSTGRELWTFSAPGPVASGPSIVDGRVLWGYGFTLFGGPGPGGVISFGSTTHHPTR